MKILKSLTLLLALSCLCSTQAQEVIVGAQAYEEYLPLLKGKKAAIFSNHTGMVGNEHTLDILIKNKVEVIAIFSPEHGFRGDADAGEHVSSSVDKKTGIPIRSLYDGASGKPSRKSMQDFDVLIVDIQDVGLRYYTYYASMVELMEACAENNKSMLILDRPNPTGHYVDGPIMDMQYKSHVGYLPIPTVHGMTLGELATMVNGEQWLPNNLQCKLEVILCKNYTHQTMYNLPIPPSPNLPNMASIYLYASICYFEATPVSLGRGTELPFQIYGHPKMKGYSYSFTPKSVSGAKKPPQLGNLCHGVDLSKLSEGELLAKKIDLSYLIDAYTNLKMGDKFFTPFFEKLSGAAYIRTMIIEGKSAQEIQDTWKDDVAKFKKQRAPYLLYKE
ncbi:hypothetical protein AwDysgo_13380 [Bacteroidales bacterium]|nr:hypothetical protein AwDysgo_13380 [Bacteroidales bacterium]